MIRATNGQSRAQFAAVLLVVIGPGALCAPVTKWLDHGCRQRAAVNRLDASGEWVLYDFQRDARTDMFDVSREPPGPAPVRRVIGHHYFTTVVSISATSRDFGDDDMLAIGQLKGIEDLALNETRVSDAGLVHLVGLRRLRHLALEDTDISDAGIVHLKKLKQLEGLATSGTRITPAGVAELRRALPNTYIDHIDVVPLKERTPFDIDKSLGREQRE